MLNPNEYINRIIATRYKILKSIGHGASSCVFQAVDLMMNREVAVKIFDKDADEYKMNSRSFETEITALSAMDPHANIVEIYDASFSGDLHYFVMEYVKGISLRRYIDRIYAAEGRQIENERICSLSKQILRALQEVHNSGIVHRDIKPLNILLVKSNNDYQVKLADFGIACLPKADYFAIKGRGVGSLHYISPEQGAGETVTPAGDIYSLGVVMYEMATGRVPFDGAKPEEIIRKHQEAVPEHPRYSNLNLWQGLEQIILKALEKDPRNRYRSAREMLRDIEKVEQSREHTLTLKGGKEKKPAIPSAIKWEPFTEKKKAERDPRRPVSPKQFAKDTVSAEPERTNHFESQKSVKSFDSRILSLPFKFGKEGDRQKLRKWIAIVAGLAVLAMLIGFFGVPFLSKTFSPSGYTVPYYKGKVLSELLDGDGYLTAGGFK
ncbi:MAG: protein kinase, partial [Clostridia bacterium]|nr:protein kinase [Clostridia bacterium]